MAQKCKLSLGACTFIPGLKVHPEAILKENEHFTNKQTKPQNIKFRRKCDTVHETRGNSIKQKQVPK